MGTKARNIADLGSNDVIETTATGVDVTGTVSADGLTVENTGVIAASFNGGSAATYVRWSDATDNWFIGTNTGLGGMLFKNETADANRFFIGSNGDVSFYEDTGTTAKMVWDASAERLLLDNDIVVGNGASSGDYSVYFRADSASGNNAAVTKNHNGSLDIVASLNDSVFQPLTFKSSPSTERMRIDAAGNVGIGTDNPIRKLHIYESGTGNVGIEIDNPQVGEACTIGKQGNTAYGATSVGDTHVYTYDSNITLMADGGAGNTSAIKFATGGSSERARIDSSGNLLVGTTTQYGATGVTLQSDGLVYARRNNTPAYLRRDGGGGDLIYTEINGTFAGAIGYDDASGFYIDGEGGHTGIGFASANWLPRDNRAYVDNVVDLGHPSFRFDDLHATNGTIQTSDRNEKQDIEVLDEAEQRVAQACKGLLRKFRWKDSVEEKGDEARIHFGIIAQDLQDAFTAEGLDAGRYAMFISSTWTDEETGEERTRLGVRYPELLAFIISAL